ncbi:MULTISPECIES: GNAT family N-acetyltransferase [unclassified Bradyrhizobium]
MYRIREVDGQDEDVADTLAELHQQPFFGARSSVRSWTLVVAFDGVEPVAFAGLVASTHVDNAGYFCRVGVLREHLGRSLQLRLMRALEARARRNGWYSTVSDTTDNIASANNFIRAGYRLYQPQAPWAWPRTRGDTGSELAKWQPAGG